MVFYILVPFLLMFSVASAQDNKSSGDQMVAFVANVDNNWDLFIANINGTNPRQLTNTPYDEMEPAWSPDQKNIVFCSTDGILRMLNIEDYVITEIPLNADEMKISQPYFSPDGKSLVASISFQGEIDKSQLAFIDLSDLSIEFPIKQSSLQLYPSWSMDGRVIYYTYVTCGMECGRIIQEIWSYSIFDGMPQQKLLTNSHCQSVEASPDGNELVFSSNMNGDFEIWKYNFETADLSNITENPALDINPTWSPDGNKIAFVSTRENQIGIFLFDIHSGNITPYRPFDDSAVECKDPDL